MRALIFCAGLGVRLRPITNTIPKPLVEVAGKPVLEHIANHLNKFGVDEIIINLHWKYQKIIKYFGNRFLYYYEPKLLGTYRTTLALKEWLGDEFLLVNGDTLTDLNIRWLKSFAGNVNAESWDSGKEVFTGIRYCNRSYFNGGHMARYLLSHYWQDIGTPQGLMRAREYYEKKKIAKV